MEWVLFGLGILAVGGALYLGYRERRDYSRLQEQASKGSGELEEVSLVVADLEQELTQTAERIVTALEERAETLRRLIEEAREVAEQVGATSGLGSASGLVEPLAPPPVANPPVAEEVKPARPPRKSSRVKEPSASVEGPVGGAVSPEPQTVGGQEAAALRGWRTMEARVWELAGQGRDVEQIARELAIGKGEVKLILDLKKAQAR